mmetsp:Transcript_31548/g.80849  ORF Transcript_31548/g.80849 Transcript_31548/m.80849 type:complete len:201 (+) Transcript_31548:475-1077(+)
MFLSWGFSTVLIFFSFFWASSSSVERRANKLSKVVRPSACSISTTWSLVPMRVPLLKLTPLGHSSLLTRTIFNLEPSRCWHASNPLATASPRLLSGRTRFLSRLNFEWNSQLIEGSRSIVRNKVLLASERALLPAWGRGEKQSASPAAAVPPPGKMNKTNETNQDSLEKKEERDTPCEAVSGRLEKVRSPDGTVCCDGLQ